LRTELIINTKLAIASIRSNKVRASLTLSIISFGIMALVGILTAIDGLKASINNNFATLGTNTFTIRQGGTGLRRRGEVSDKIGAVIDYNQAQQFKNRFRYPAVVSVSCVASFNATIKNGSYKTNPNVRVTGADENYLKVLVTDIEKGRYFNMGEVQTGANVVLLGKDVVKKIIPPYADLTKTEVLIGANRYKVLGVLHSKGSSMMNNADNQVVIPLLNASRNYKGNSSSYTITVSVNTLQQLNEGVEEATALMRKVRGIEIGKSDDFEIRMSDAVANRAMEDISYITVAATLIGFITLFGAGIGLMNIMLVLVTERTREIGVAKALGATRSSILLQFLTEAVVICQIGGILGVALGILMGNLVSLFFESGFIVPWLWMFMGLFFCLIVGVVAGLYPAIKASKLDPIEALRYE
jgi:putative ABC transport system permease protein